MANFTGTSGDDIQAGASDSDSFDYSQGGSDTLTGGGGDLDQYVFGAAFDAGDMVIGTVGTDDRVVLSGDYSAGLTVSLNQFVDLNELQLNGGFAYDLTLTDGAGAGSTGLVISSHASAVHLDASDVTTTAIKLSLLNQQDVRFTGGGGDDVVFYSFVAAGAHDRRDGGTGTDTLLFLGPTVDLHLHASQMRNFERLEFTGAVKVVDANVAAGQTLAVQIDGPSTFDGHKETDGAFDIGGSGGDDILTGGKGADTITAGAGADVIAGGKGADELSGGPGAVTFVYKALSDSTRLVFDTIHGLDSGDTIDLSRIDARSDKAGNQAFTLVDNFTHHAGELTLSFDGAGTTTLSGDVDGDGKADLVIHITGDQTGFTGFVL